MADPWKAPEGGDSAPAVVPRQVDRYALQSTLADLVRTVAAEAPEAAEPTRSKKATPGRSGHQALAALAAEVAEAAAQGSDPIGPDEGGDNQRSTSSRLTGLTDQPTSGAGDPATGLLPRSRPRPFGGPPKDSSAPTGQPSGVATGSLGSSASSPGLRPVGWLRSGLDDHAAGSLPTSAAGAVRLSPSPRPDPASVVDQATIPLRRRPVAPGPDADAPPELGSQAVAPASVPRVAGTVEAWTPSDDDLLPRRQVRRGRSSRRR